MVENILPLLYDFFTGAGVNAAADNFQNSQKTICRQEEYSTLQQKSFKEQFPKDHRPEITDLQAFWEDSTFSLFSDFAEYISQKYDLRFGIPLWTKACGWTYRIGKSGGFLVKGIRIEKNCFIVDGMEIDSCEKYSLLLEHIEEVYQQNREGFYKKIAEKNRRQAERNKARIAREKREFAAISSCIITDQYNRFCWPGKLDIHKLNKLYMLDAKGIHDEVLADEIGLTLYLRCKYGKKDMELMGKNKIRCHGCGRELGGETDFRQCSCGRQYSYREYRRSFRRNNMPYGAAAKIFAEYIVDWSKARTYSEKMILIDTLLHEFHLSMISGARGRSVAMNFIDGTSGQVKEIICNLARN